MSSDGSDGAVATTLENDGARQRPDGTDSRIEDGQVDRVTRILDHPAVVSVGVLAVVVGLVTAVGITLVSDLPTRAIVTAAALGAVVCGTVAAGRRITSTVDQAETSAVEFRGDVTVPGTEFDAELSAAVSGVHTARAKARRHAGERLRDVATGVHAAVDGLPEADARERVESGDWDDDATRHLDHLSTDSVPDQIRTGVGGTSSIERNADRVVTALAETMPGVAIADDESVTDSVLPSRTDDRPETEDATGGDLHGTDRRTGRWVGLVGLVLFALGAGTLTSLGSVPPSLVVAAAVHVGAAALVALSSPPTVALAVERSIEPERPEPGEQVTVTVTFRNTGPDLIPDLRVVDGVPPGLQVVDGSPRYATALGSDESVTFSYVVEATRGKHAFEPAHVLARGFSGAIERDRHVAPDSPDEIECVFELGADASVPVHPQTARRVGRVLTDSGGSGVELHSVREYRRGDPLTRIDWNRVATTGEFATLQFREEHAATVVVLVDARKESYVASRVDAPAAPELSLDAADVLVSSLLSSGDSVGLAALSPEWCWLEPRGGDTQRARARRLMATHSAFDASRPEEPFYGTLGQKRLRRELPADAQLVLLSPLCDDRAMRIAREFHARGYPVTVVSPDATGSRTIGQRLAAVERAVRLSRLRRGGVRVVDWDPDETLQTAVEAAERRWSA